MLCPFCQHPESQVIDSRQSLYNNIGGIRRRRQCSQCQQRFSSFEMTINDLEGVEPATLDGILQQIIKVFRDAPRTNYKGSSSSVSDKIGINDNQPSTTPLKTSYVENGIAKKITDGDIKEALQRARQKIAKRLDELDASEFDEGDFD